MDSLREDMSLIYNRYYSDLYYYCLRMCNGNVHQAEDITQNTFFKAIQKISSFRGETNIRYWLRQIAKNDYISFLRKEKHLLTGEAADILLENAESYDTDIQGKIEDNEQVKAINEILDGLDAPYADVFRLRVLHETEYKEIAGIFNKTENWARVTYYRAKQKIIEAMNKEGMKNE